MPHLDMAFQTTCPHCALEMPAIGGDIGTVCLCPRCGKKFAVYTFGARECAPDETPGDDVKSSAPTKPRKRRKRLLLTVVSCVLIVVACLAFAFARSSILRVGLWDRDFDPNHPQTSQQRAQRDLDMAAVCLLDQTLFLMFSGQALEEGFSAAFITRCVAEFEKIDVTRCPDDFRVARATVLAALREFGTNQRLLEESDSKWKTVAAMATIYTRWDQVKPAFEGYRHMLSRYQIKVDFKPTLGPFLGGSGR